MPIKDEINFISQDLQNNRRKILSSSARGLGCGKKLSYSE
jgi:hypothetical protein